MPLTVTERNTVANSLTPRLTHVSLHTADPGTTGASEAAGGSYARQALTWSAASAGIAVANEVTFSVPAGTYTHFGVWNAASGGTFRGGNALTTSAIISPAGEVKVTVSVPVTAS